jgi:hypothetical protein
MLSTKEKGDLAVASAISYFMSSGYEVCLPIGDKKDYDLVVEKDRILSRVQVKYAGLYPSRGNSCRAALRITGGNQSRNTAKKYDDSAFELLYVFTAKNERYLIPWKNLTARNEIYVEHRKYQRYNVSSLQS